MNKSHRIVWSDARNAYIVAGENASAKGKPSSVRKALATAIAALFMGPGLAAAQSCEGQNPLTDAQTSTQCYENVDVTVAAGGSVAAAGTTAIGVQVQAAPYARNFANQGTLEADAEGYNAYAYGVLFEDRVSGSVVNAATGTVSVSAMGQGNGYGDGYGVLVRGDLGGSLTNEGTVEVSAQNVASSGYRYAGAYGVSIDGDVDGTLSNSGNVRAESRADSVGGSSYAYTDAESVRIRGSLNGALANSGAIEAHAQSAEGSSNYNDYVRAYGVSIGEDLAGSLENTGTIHAMATRSSEGGYSSYSDYMWAVGVHVSDDLTGDLLNSGEILARTEVSGGDQYGYANAYGVRAYGTMSGTIDNAGTIGAESVRTGGDGGSSTYTKAYGVVTGDLVGKLDNSGSISARSEVEEGYAHAYAYGVSTYYGDLIGTIENDGEIAAEAVSKDGYAGAYGVGVGYNVSGTLQNNGEVSARAEAMNARTRGVSIRYGDLIGTIENKGMVDSTAITQDGYANAVGVAVGAGEDYDGEDYYGYGKVSGTLRNAGSVTATAIAQGRESGSGYTLLAMEEEPEPSTSIAVRAGSTYAIGVGTGLVSSQGRIENTGSVVAEARSEAVADAEDEAYASAYGADAVGLASSAVDGKVSNTGSISASATLSASATGDAAAAFATEAWASGASFGGAGGDFDNGGSIVSRATVTALANGGASASAYAGGAEAAGVEIWVSDPGVYTGNFTNSGTIQAEATLSAVATGEEAEARSDYGASAVGIAAEHFDGRFTNTGTIHASASATVTANGENVGEAADAGAIGVWVLGRVGAGGVLDNSGTISAVAEAAAKGMSVVAGVMIGSDESMSEPTLDVMVGEDVPEDGFYGTLNNSGTITAEGRGGIESAGVFSVFASGGTGTVNNLQGGVMSGRLFLGGEVAMNNAGTLDIRDSASYVGGAFTQSATGVLKIDVVPVRDEEGAVIDTTYGSLHVGGTAQLADGTGVRVMVDPASTLANGDKLDDVVLAEGDITRGAVKVTDNVLPLNFTVTSDANQSPKDLDLSVVSTGLTTISNAVNAAGLGSATGVAGVLDGLLGSADSQPGALGDFLFDVGSSGNAREVADKVATLLPLASGGVTTATLGALHGANRVVQARVDSNLGRSSGDGFLGDKRMWLKGFGSWAEQDARSGASGYDADTAGLAVGVDAIVTDTNRVGVLFAYSETDVDSTGAAKQSADVDTYQLGLYGSHTLDERTDINGMIGFGRHSTDGTRHTTGGVAASSYDSSSIVAGVGIARTYPMSEKTTLTPSVRLDYARIKDDAYQEQGAGALDLSVGKNTVSELILSLDGKITHELSDTLTFVGHAGVGYDFENEQSSITSTLAGAPGASFVTRGVDPSPWLVRAGLGLVNTPIESWEFSARYEVEGRSDFLNHTAWLRARKAF
jgi:autotransporter family porin